MSQDSPAAAPAPGEPSPGPRQPSTESPSPRQHSSGSPTADEPSPGEHLSRRPASHTSRWSGLARTYFAIQALLGAAWWVGVFTIPAVRDATLGHLPPAAVAAFDIPFFVLASAGAAAKVRPALWVSLIWSPLVAAGMVVYATVTGAAGIGAVAMIAAAAASIGCGLYLLLGHIPAQLVFIGPFRFQSARNASELGPLARTVIQLIQFWGLFLVVIPLVLNVLEARWQVGLPLSDWAGITARILGIAALVAASAFGVWSAAAMARIGRGTPLPSDMATRLVVVGPYRWVRNPMAVAGISQGVAVGLIMNSWLVVAYALAGSLVWNWLIRPYEEADLARRFGAEFSCYCESVSCWVPRRARMRP